MVFLCLVSTPNLETSCGRCLIMGCWLEIKERQKEEGEDCLSLMPPFPQWQFKFQHNGSGASQDSSELKDMGSPGGTEPWHSNITGVPQSWASPMAQWVKNPPAMHETQETQVQSLGWEDPLKEGMATHSSILVWRIAQTEEPGGLWSKGFRRVRPYWACMHATKLCLQHRGKPDQTQDLMVDFQVLWWASMRTISRGRGLHDYSKIKP